MMGLPDPAAAGNQFRAADTDRERVVETLRHAFTQGRLTSEELDARTDHALVARTYADLDTVTSDLPGVSRTSDQPVPAADQAAAPPDIDPGPHWPLVSAAIRSVGYLFVAFVLVYSANLIDNSDPDGIGPGPHHAWTRLMLFLTLVLIVTSLAVLERGIAAAVQRRRSRKRPPSAGTSHS